MRASEQPQSDCGIRHQEGTIDLPYSQWATVPHTQVQIFPPPLTIASGIPLHYLFLCVSLLWYHRHTSVSVSRFFGKDSPGYDEIVKTFQSNDIPALDDYVQSSKCAEILDQDKNYGLALQGTLIFINLYVCVCMYVYVCMYSVDWVVCKLVYVMIFQILCLTNDSVYDSV